MPQSMAMNSTIVPCHNPLHAYTIALLLSKASLPCPTAKDAFDFFHTLSFGYTQESTVDVCLRRFLSSHLPKIPF